jgi:hypothetical protein
MERGPRGCFEGSRARRAAAAEVEGAALPGLLNGTELLCRGSGAAGQSRWVG